MELTLCCPERGDYVVWARLARVVVTASREPCSECPCPKCERPVACPPEERSALRLIGLGLKAAPPTRRPR